MTRPTVPAIKLVCRGRDVQVEVIRKDFTDDARMAPRVVVDDDGRALSCKPSQGAGDPQACTNASEVTPRFERPGRLDRSERHEGCS